VKTSGASSEGGRKPTTVRAAWATGLSLVLHALVLTGMVVGLRVAAPPPENRAIDLQLIPAPELQPRPEPLHRSPERSSAAPPLRPHFAPQPSSEASALALPEVPTPAPAATPGAGLKGLLPSLSGRLGCDDSEASRLTPEQRQACANALARLAQETKSLSLNIPDQKKAGYDRYVRCFNDYTRGGVPSSGGHDPSSGSIAGLGYVPSFKECPVEDR